MSRIAYVNGRYVAQRAASVNIEDRGLQFADSIYEVIPLLRGEPVDEARHLQRLARSLHEIQLALPLHQAGLRCVLREVARRNRVTDGIVYIQVTRGVARREHTFPAAIGKPGIVVTARALPPPPRDIAAGGVRAITLPDQRWARCDIKTTGLLPNVLARQAARQAEAYEAILFDADGMVTEGAATTVWIVDAAGVLRTRGLDHTILPGCTRAALLALLDEAGTQYAERGFSVAELRAAREVFLTSASSYVRPVVAIDGAPIGDGTPGPVTRRLYLLLLTALRGGLRNAA
jgi:D-alanine transaminase